MIRTEQLMETPHYVVHQDNSGDFVVERTDPDKELTRALTGGAGAALLWHGARRSGWLAAFAVAGGAELFCRACTGKSLLDLFGPPRKAAPADAPGYRDGGQPSNQQPTDAVEAA